MHCASCCKQDEIALVLALEVRRLSSSVKRREAATSRFDQAGGDTERHFSGVNPNAKQTCTLSLLHTTFIGAGYVGGQDGSQLSAKHGGRSRPHRTQQITQRSKDDAFDTFHHGVLLTRLGVRGLLGRHVHLD